MIQKIHVKRSYILSQLVKNLQSQKLAQDHSGQLEDFIDMSVFNENFKELIFQNTKFQQNGSMYEQILKIWKARGAERNIECQFTVGQLRSKSKKLVADGVQTCP